MTDKAYKTMLNSMSNSNVNQSLSELALYAH